MALLAPSVGLGAPSNQSRAVVRVVLDFRGVQPCSFGSPRPHIGVLWLLATFMRLKLVPLPQEVTTLTWVPRQLTRRIRDDRLGLTYGRTHERLTRRRLWL